MIRKPLKETRFTIDEESLNHLFNQIRDIARAERFGIMGPDDENYLIVDNGEYIEVFNGLNENKCNYLQYNPYDGRVYCKKNISSFELEDIIEEWIGDNSDEYTFNQ